MSKVIKIENVSETAYRFSTVLKFIPGQVTVVTEEEMKSKPVIQLLIDRGILKIVGAKNKPTEEIEEA